MKKSNLLLLFVFSFVTSFAQFPDNWELRYQTTLTPNYSSEGRKTATDANSNIFVLGDYSSDKDSAGNNSATTLYSVRLQKYNYSGTLVTWRYITLNGLVNNGFDNRSSFGLELDAIGNVYIGYTSLNASGNYDVVIRQYSNALALKWSYSYATGNNDVGIAMKLVGSTVVAVVKTTSGANNTYSVVVTGNAGISSTPLYSFTQNVDVVNAVMLSGNKTYYFTGYSMISGAKSAMTAAVSSTGNLKWKSQFNNGSVTGDDYGTNLMLGTDGIIDVVGTSYKNAANGNDAMLLRYTISGVLSNALLLNRSTTDVGTCIAQGPTGFVYLAASNTTEATIYKVSLNPLNGGTYIPYGPTPASSFTSITNTTVSDMKVATSGNVYLCGSVDATSAGGNFTASFLAKFGMNGFFFKMLNSQSVEGDFTHNYRPVSLSLDGYKADILLLRNFWSNNTNHSNELYKLNDYDGGTTLRTAGSMTSADENLSPAVDVFPNPASDKINIRAGENISSVELSDMTGQVVKLVTDLLAKETAINLSEIRQGIYFCKIISEQGTVTIKKIIVQ